MRCRKASGACCGMATTDDGVLGTAAAVTGVVVVATGATRVRWVLPNASRRDAAASARVSGLSAGTAGSSPVVRITVAVAVGVIRAEVTDRTDARGVVALLTDLVLCWAEGRGAAFPVADEPVEPPGAAAASPAPETIATPIPSATASPPIRPTNAPAPIRL